jgi:hypothetical protein
MPDTQPRPPLKVFLSYSHHDDDMRQRFVVHLSQLTRDGLIAPWSDRQIKPGDDWAGAIDENLNSAQIIILLASPDFLASNYINDVEMDRAMERDRKGEARVVPLILKPSDWQSTRFARLQALPTGGKPVVDWPSWDHGFDDAVAGLRRMVHEMRNPAPPPVTAVRKEVSRHPWLWSFGLVIVTALLVSWWLWSNSQGYLRQGTTLLNVGRYADARPALEQAKKWNHFSSTASCGLEAIRLDSLRKDGQFKAFLDQANRNYPNCAYLTMLNGDQKYLADDREGALAEYQKAIKLEPDLAEGQFNVGRIQVLDGHPDEALGPLKKAAELSPGTPAYHNNLAALYFQRRDYDEAIQEYGKVAEFPLSALEAATIFRLQSNLEAATDREGKLEMAAEREEDAIKWLQRPTAESVEQGHAWAFDVSLEEQRRLGPLDEKQCYADLESAATRYLQGDESAAKERTNAAIGKSGKCKTRRADLTAILKWEMRRLGGEVPQLTKRTDEYTAKYLGPLP